MSNPYDPEIKSRFNPAVFPFFTNIGKNKIIQNENGVISVIPSDVEHVYFFQQKSKYDDNNNNNFKSSTLTKTNFVKESDENNNNNNISKYNQAFEQGKSYYEPFQKPRIIKMIEGTNICYFEKTIYDNFDEYAKKSQALYLMKRWCSSDVEQILKKLIIKHKVKLLWMKLKLHVLSFEMKKIILTNKIKSLCLKMKNYYYKNMSYQEKILLETNNKLLTKSNNEYKQKNKKLEQELIKKENQSQKIKNTLKNYIDKNINNNSFINEKENENNDYNLKNSKIVELYKNIKSDLNSIESNTFITKLTKRIEKIDLFLPIRMEKKKTTWFGIKIDTSFDFALQRLNIDRKILNIREDQLIFMTEEEKMIFLYQLTKLSKFLNTNGLLSWLMHNRKKENEKLFEKEIEIQKENKEFLQIGNNNNFLNPNINNNNKKGLFFEKFIATFGNVFNFDLTNIKQKLTTVLFCVEVIHTQMIIQKKNKSASYTYYNLLTKIREFL